MNWFKRPRRPEYEPRVEIDVDLDKVVAETKATKADALRQSGRMKIAREFLANIKEENHFSHRIYGEGPA